MGINSQYSQCIGAPARHSDNNLTSDIVAAQQQIHRCSLRKVGQVGYQQGLDMQAEARGLVCSGGVDGILLLLEHLPVITIGRAGGADNLQLSPEVLRAQGVELVNADRGGNVTCHNPNQLVGYPILNLSRWTQDVHWYVYSLEEVLIRSLAHFGLRAGRKSKYTGVWLDDEKIAAIGVSVKRWVTGHGFALNINNDLELFRTIVPCGIQEFGVTSLSKAGVEVNVEEVSRKVQQEFEWVFHCEFE